MKTPAFLLGITSHMGSMMLIIRIAGLSHFATETYVAVFFFGIPLAVVAVALARRALKRLPDTPQNTRLRKPLRTANRLAIAGMISNPLIVSWLESKGGR